MAVVSGTVQNVHGHTTAGGPRFNGSNVPLLTCVVTATFTGTYVQNDNAQILAVKTAIQNSRQDNRTVTLLQAMMEHPGIEGASTAVGAKTVAVSTADLTMELVGSDMTTEHTGAALSTFTAPIGFRVLYSLA